MRSVIRITKEEGNDALSVGGINNLYETGRITEAEAAALLNAFALGVLGRMPFEERADVRKTLTREAHAIAAVAASFATLDVARSAAGVYIEMPR